MTINTFKKYCLKAGTKKADEIHDYYINLEELLFETMNEESDELRMQLQAKDTDLQAKDNQLIKNNSEHQKNIKLNTHKILLEKMKSKKCIYVGEIEENKLIKIGSSKDVVKRDDQLNKRFGNCLFLEIFECDNFREIEDNILADLEIKKIYIKNL
jgi:hypothetical protein